MFKELEEALAKYPEWISQFEFDPQFGYLIDPSYTPVSFDYSILANILTQLSALNASGQIIKAVKEMPAIKINAELGPPHKDMVILHDGCSYLIHSFVKVLKDQGV